MPQRLLIDPSDLDLQHVAYSIDDIRKVNPHRYEFEQLTSILLINEEEKLIVGLRDIRPDEFWARGHIPGRPIFPGVLMLEAAAQLCSFYCGTCFPGGGFLGFGGINDVKFRGVVVPGDKLILVARGKTVSNRRSLFETQGIVNGKIAFQAAILGLRLG